MRLRLALAAVVCALAACGPPDEGGAARPDDAANVRAVAEAAERARSLPGVVAADGSYETGITGHGATLLWVTVAQPPPPGGVELLLDSLERLACVSRIHPMTVLGVSVVRDGAEPRAAPLGERLYQGRDRVAALADKFGPRPTRS